MKIASNLREAKRIAFIVVILLVTSISAKSQDVIDALRYSEYRLHGTARAAAMGNAFGALGGDFTSASINPAGIGLYRSNEIALTLKYRESNIEGTYLNNTVNASRSRMSVPNFGYVATFDTRQNAGSPLVSINIGMGYNRMNDFNLRKRVQGTNATSTMLDQLTVNINDNPQILNNDESLEWMAWQTFLLNQDENAIWFNDIAEAGYGQSQSTSFSHKGSIEEYLFSIAANINHKLYLGLTFGIHDLYFRELVNHSEFGSSSEFFDNFTLASYLRTTGTGYNIKLGVIYRPVDPLRLGVALHTPTWYDLRDLYYQDLFSRAVDDDGNFGDFSEIGPAFRYDYDLRTPLRAVFSAAWTFGQTGLLSADYEVVNYRNAQFSSGSDGYEFDDENDKIENALRTIGNLHIGGEYRPINNLSLRAGFEYLPSPYRSGLINENAHTYTYSAGAGWRYKGFFADLAYKRSTQSDNIIDLYPVPFPDDTGFPEARFKNNFDNIMLTLGFRF